MEPAVTQRMLSPGRAILFGFLILAGGCSTFDHEWREAARSPQNLSELSGRWQGVWTSEVNGHNGALRCVISSGTNGVYRARFHAKYRKVLNFGYTVALKAERIDNGFVFDGDANLGWLAGGNYQYAGHAGPTNFFSTYTCKYDHGTFEMQRQ